MKRGKGKAGRGKGREGSDKIGRTGRRECGRAREDMTGKEWKGEGNSLPVHLRDNSLSLSCFNRHLKTFLFAFY